MVDALLDVFLTKKNVYYDAAILKTVINLLAEKKLVKEVGNTISIIGYFEPEQNAEPGKIPHPKDWLGDVEGAIKQCEITPKGRDYVNKGQGLDVVGIAERKAAVNKWVEKTITFLITVLTAVAVTWFTEPVKQWWAEQKRNPKTESLNASSPVRPRLNPRQRPEPRKPVGAAAPRGRARR